MKKIDENNVDLGRYAEVVVVLPNNENSRKMAECVSKMCKNGLYTVSAENYALVTYVAGGIYVCNSEFDVHTFCSQLEVEEVAAKKKDLVGAFSKVLDSNDSIITFELTVFLELSFDDVVKLSQASSF